MGKWEKRKTWGRSQRGNKAGKSNEREGRERGEGFGTTEFFQGEAAGGGGREKRKESREAFTREFRLSQGN